MSETMTRSQLAATEVAGLLRARKPIIWIVTQEEVRAEQYLFEAAAAAKYECRFWDVASGATELSGQPAKCLSSEDRASSRDPGEMLRIIRERATLETVPQKDRCAWIMRDVPVWLGNGQLGAGTLRSLCNLARLRPAMEPAQAQAVIIISPDGTVPPELRNHAAVIDWPLPDRQEIEDILDAAVEAIEDDAKRAKAVTNGARAAAIDAAIGLTGEDAAACYSRSLVTLGRIDPTVVAGEKKRIISRERVLEWFDPLPGGLEMVGGLEVAKDWLGKRALAYTPAARAYNLPMPKGLFAVGVPGCGKSMLAKAVGTTWKCPLIRLDLNALKDKFVGGSEGNLRRALQVIEALGFCIVWIDEIEKALAGATQGAADGGVSADALGTILSWMQERKSQAFVIATANDVSVLPPELLRKGRFDEVFFVDLPTSTERVAVLASALKAHGITPPAAAELATVPTENFTGAEIAALVPEAMFAAFNDKQRPVTVADLVTAAKDVVPLADTMAEKITKLRDWVKGRARNASLPEVVTERKAVRRVEM